MRYVASLSCGKDSLAMLLRLMEEQMPLTDVVMFDTGMEYQAIYKNLDKIRPILLKRGINLTVLTPEHHWLYDMLLRPVHYGTEKEHWGYSWCGLCRWRTADKVGKIQKFLNSLGEYVQYIGIAADEKQRAREEKNKIYPLIQWGMTEKDCLKYCYDRGWSWDEEGVELYEVLDRVSCWCCQNKSLKELRNMYHFLPRYWSMLKGLQSRMDIPYRRDGKTVFDLEERFKTEDAQMSIFDFIEVS